MSEASHEGLVAVYLGGCGGILFLNLVGGDWNMWIMTFHIVGRIIPTDQYFFRGVVIPPTSMEL